MSYGVLKHLFDDGEGPKNAGNVPSILREGTGRERRKPAWNKAVPSVPYVPLQNSKCGNENSQNTTPAPAPEAPEVSPQELPADPVPDWRPLAQAYHMHHFHCHHCQAAGRGRSYSERCGTGLVLWAVYQDAVRTAMETQP